MRGIVVQGVLWNLLALSLGMRQYFKASAKRSAPLRFVFKFASLLHETQGAIMKPLRLFAEMSRRHSFTSFPITSSAPILSF